MRPRQAREMCLKFLFASEFKKYELTAGSNETATEPELIEQLSSFKKAFKASNEVWGFVKRVVLVLSQNHEEIDKIISAQLDNWKLDRLSYTDKNILRVALCESLYLELNPKIAMNEAIELSKLYSSSESASFINGILDAVFESKGLKHG